MRIAIVHSFYTSVLPSGENAVVEEQVKALTEAGHDVHLVARYTDTDSGQLLYPVRSGVRVMTGFGPDPTSELRAFAPDVVHVHNLFPNFGTRWLRDWSGPIVATLHNFRPLCANGLLFRDGHYCEDCPTGRWTSAVRHACYHDSRVASIPLALRNARGPARDPVLSRADALICLSEQAAAIYRRFGGEHLPIRVIPNGIDLPVRHEPAEPNGRWLVVSRLTPEKGVRELVEIWPEGEHLDIIGSGPEEGAARSLDRPSVQFLGQRTREEVLAAMPSYTGLLFPSRCLEMHPTVLTEALAAGVPVVASQGNAGADLVTATGGGVIYTDRGSLTTALRAVGKERQQMSGAARLHASTELARTAWIATLLAAYHSAIQDSVRR
jgi:glycosyltransferase involved in cell wall biosynthesis